MSLILPSLDFTEILPLHTATISSMNTEDYWLMAREYSIWNATIASLQFWTEDLDPVTLGRATECVYTTFFYSPMSHTLHQQSDETLFGHFVRALNAAFDQQLLLSDEGYESGSDPIDLPTPLRKTPCIHQISSMEHTSFNPILTTTCSTPQTPPRPCTYLKPIRSRAYVYSFFILSQSKLYFCFVCMYIYDCTLVLQLYVPSQALHLPLAILKPLEECARAQSWVTRLASV